MYNEVGMLRRKIKPLSVSNNVFIVCCS
jgi:hypothetical protein